MSTSNGHHGNRQARRRQRQREGRHIAALTEIPCRYGFLWPRWRLTYAGSAFVAGLVVVGTVAANPGLNLLLLLFGLATGAVVFNVLASRRQVANAEIERLLPDVAATGRPTVIRYRVRNRSSLGAVRSLWLVEEPHEHWMEPAVPVAYVEHIRRGGEAFVEAPIVPVRRGVHRFRAVQMGSKFPFGLVKRLRRHVQEGQLLVWPALWRPRIDWLGRATQPQSPSARSRQWQRGSDEFFGIREYRPGDNVRWIHWRRSASLGQLLVREMAATSPGHVTLAIETGGADGPADEAVVDDLISAAASLACDALERGWHVGVILNGNPNIVLPPAGGRIVRTRLLYELAIAQPSRHQRLGDVLADWPGGTAWAGRAVLLHPGGLEPDPAVEAAAAQLAAQIGSVTRLSHADMPAWFETGILGVDVAMPRGYDLPANGMPAASAGGASR